MKATQTCPKCGSRQIWVIEKVAHKDHPSTHKARAIPVTAMEVTSRGSWGFSERDYVEIGSFEAWICARCGFTEWYARNINEAFSKLVQEPSSGVHFIDGSTHVNPHR